MSKTTMKLQEIKICIRKFFFNLKLCNFSYRRIRLGFQLKWQVVLNLMHQIPGLRLSSTADAHHLKILDFTKLCWWAEPRSTWGVAEG